MVTPSSKPCVVVLGAGISGLACAWFLKQRYGSAIDLHLLEASHRTGGWIETFASSGFLFEKGPRSLRTKGAGRTTLQLVETLGLTDRVVSADPHAQTRYLYLDGQLRAMPKGVLSAIANPYTRAVFPHLLKEWWVAPAKEDESIHSFFRRRFGAQAAEFLADPMVSGIFAGDPKQLSLQSCFPLLHEMEQSGSVLKGMFRRKKPARPSSSFVQQMQKTPIFSFDQGLQVLVDALEDRLSEHLCLNTPVTRLEANGTVHTASGSLQADTIISALPACTLATLFETEHPVLSRELSTISYAPLAVVHLGYKKEVLDRKGFGYLIPHREQQAALGVVFDSCVFPQHSREPGETRLTVMLGGSRDTTFHETDEATYLERARQTVREHLNINEQEQVAVVEKLSRSVPQYAIGHAMRLQRLQALAHAWNSSFHLCGNSFFGVGVNDCIKHAENLVATMQSPSNLSRSQEVRAFT